MTVSVRAFCLVFVFTVGTLSFADEPAPETVGPEIASLVSEMEKLLGTELPCPTGEAQATPEWTACVERWEKMKTEELYLPLASHPVRSTASEPHDGDETPGSPAHEN